MANPEIVTLTATTNGDVKITVADLIALAKLALVDQASVELPADAVATVSLVSEIGTESVLAAGQSLRVRLTAVADLDPTPAEEPVTAAA